MIVRNPYDREGRTADLPHAADVALIYVLRTRSGSYCPAGFAVS